jgi:GNAT superfamily N-acetyltransferase
MIDVVTCRGLPSLRPLASIADKYPDGGGWLERRFDDLARGRGEIAALMSGPSAAAWAIVTPKGMRRHKLSTFLVAPHARHRGLGRSLLAWLQARWWAEEIERVHVTVDELDLATRRFFEANGFSLAGGEGVDYGPGRRDLVYLWSASAYRPSAEMIFRSQLNARRRFISAPTSGSTAF